MTLLNETANAKQNLGFISTLRHQVGSSEAGESYQEHPYAKQPQAHYQEAIHSTTAKAQMLDMIILVMPCKTAK